MAGTALKPGVGKRVLVVDDDPMGRKLVTLHLREAGFAVETASTGEEALRMAQGTPPDAILSDVRMTGMDGFELRRVIRRDPRLARIPIVLLSTAPIELPGRSPQNSPESDYLLRTPDLREAVDALVQAIRDRK
jgi:CheY-like chemotaxis protein